MKYCAILALALAVLAPASGSFAAAECSLGTYSPLVLDYSGADNFQSNFTGVQDGIVWDWFGRNDGPNAPDSKVHLAWTKPGKKVGFLWIDRNTGVDRTACFMAPDPKGCNGTPDNAKELFGDITPQQAPPGIKTSGAHPFSPNGFAALAMFDRKKYGGNDDGRIDRNDKVFSHLHVWFDLNHNGKLDAGEDFTLEQMGIVSISLDSKENGETDQYGNIRWLDGTVVTNNSRPIAIYDVLFVGRQ
jgi:hypothetical protein